MQLRIHLVLKPAINLFAALLLAPSVVFFSLDSRFLSVIGTTDLDLFHGASLRTQESWLIYCAARLPNLEVSQNSGMYLCGTSELT